MEEAHGTRRSRGALRRAMARRAAPLFSRAGVAAAPLEPFMLPRRTPATLVEGSLLRLHLPRPGAPAVAPPPGPGREKRR